MEPSASHSASILRSQQATRLLGLVLGCTPALIRCMSTCAYDVYELYAVIGAEISRQMVHKVFQVILTRGTSFVINRRT